MFRRTFNTIKILLSYLYLLAKKIIPERLKMKIKASSLLSVLKDASEYLSRGFLFIPINKKAELLSFKNNKIFCYLNADSAWVFHQIFSNNIYEHIFKIEKDDVVLDVGAHIGLFSIKAREKAGKDGLVIAIEPGPENLAKLRKNIEDLSNIIVIPKACGAMKRKAKLYISTYSSGNSVIYDRGVGCIDVEMDTLENITSELNLKKVNFIKIDAEGAELEILKGAKSLLDIPGIKLAIASYHYPEEVHEISAFLEGKNMDVFVESIDSQPYVYAKK